MKDEFVAIYITARTAEEAKDLGHLIVKERLAGCVNIIPKIESMYWWKGKINSHSESVLIAKTRKALVKKLIAFVKRNHSYSVPCINAIPIMDGNPDYLKWLESETSSK